MVDAHNVEELQEKAPPGFEPVVRALKGKTVNPYAVAWSMKRKGYRPASEAGKPYNPEALYRRYQHECGAMESMQEGPGSWFSNCPRDEQGRCMPSGSPGREKQPLTKDVAGVEKHTGGGAVKALIMRGRSMQQSRNPIRRSLGRRHELMGRAIARTAQRYGKANISRGEFGRRVRSTYDTLRVQQSFGMKPGAARRFAMGESDSATALGQLTRKGVKTGAEEAGNPYRDAKGEFTSKARATMTVGQPGQAKAPGGSPDTPTSAPPVRDIVADTVQASFGGNTLQRVVPEAHKLSGSGKEKALKLAKIAGAAATGAAIATLGKRLVGKYYDRPFGPDTEGSVAGAMGAAIADVLAMQAGIDPAIARHLGRKLGAVTASGIRSAVNKARTARQPEPASRMRVAGAHKGKKPTAPPAGTKYGRFGVRPGGRGDKKGFFQRVLGRNRTESWQPVIECALPALAPTNVVSLIEVMEYRGYEPTREPRALLERLAFECRTAPRLVEASYFATCQRDEQGRCMASGGGNQGTKSVVPRGTTAKPKKRGFWRGVGRTAGKVAKGLGKGALAVANAVEPIVLPLAAVGAATAFRRGVGSLPARLAAPAAITGVIRRFDRDTERRRAA